MTEQKNELFTWNHFTKEASVWPELVESFQIIPNRQVWDQVLQDLPQALSLSLPLLQGDALEVELELIDLFSETFTLSLHTKGALADFERGVHYRGQINGNDSSLAVISIFEDEITGLFSLSQQQGNWVLGRLDGFQNSNGFLLFRDDGLIFNQDFICQMPDEGNAYSAAQLQESNRNKTQEPPCLSVYYEVDYDLYREKGGQENTLKYITSLFNQVGAIFAQNDILIKLEEVYIWNAPSPYNGSTPEEQLIQFQEHRSIWSGNLAQLLSMKTSGGIAAGFTGLCAADRRESMSYAGIHSDLVSLPNYSWSVNVSAHELGHLLGSRHTHACVWNKNGTPIDDCGNKYMQDRKQRPEGEDCFSAGQARLPQGGGTLMSYCHLLDGVGVNLSRGFHEQPRQLIQNNLSKSNCLSTCTPFTSDPSCMGNEVTLRLVLDQYGSETTWAVKDKDGITMYQGGPYQNGAKGKVIETPLCLADGCFTLEVFDSFGDGLCCRYGKGSISIVDTSGLVVATISQFREQEEVDFCLNIEENTIGEESHCQQINFNDYDIQTYGGNQDFGDYEIKEKGKVIRLYGNAWKAIPIDYDIKPETVLEFDFGSTVMAEVHAIGLDNDDAVSSRRTFKLYGTQNWGILQHFNYEFPGEWRSFYIPIGYYYTGPASRLFMCVDDDEAPINGDSWFRNVRIYDGRGCSAPLNLPSGTGILPLEKPVEMTIYPNPAREAVQIEWNTPQQGVAQVEWINLMGQTIIRQEIRNVGRWAQASLSVNGLSQGTYILRVELADQLWTRRVVVTH